jgi:hypothetical protein
MRTLQRVLADSVLDALRSRDHVVVAPASDDALRNEVEAIIAPALGSITPHLGDNSVTNEKSTTFGHDIADDAVEAMIERITEQLMESDHVDDIFAEDRVIRRDAFRAVREILLAYIRGDIEIDEEFDTSTGFEVRLDSLGYLISTATRRLDEVLLVDSLERAAASVGGALMSYEASRNTGTFALVGGAEVGRLALEEAIAEEIVGLVGAELVELPGIQQVLEVEYGSCDQEGFGDGLERAAARTQNHTGCAATCAIVDERTIVATLTPLTEDAAEGAEEHFNFFLSALEDELAAVGARESLVPTSEQIGGPASGEAPVSAEPRSGNRPSTAGDSTAGERSSQTQARGRRAKNNKKRRAT